MVPFTRSRSRILKKIATDAAQEGKKKIVSRNWNRIIPELQKMMVYLTPPFPVSIDERYGWGSKIFKYIIDNKEYFRCLCEISSKFNLTLAYKITEFKKDEQCPAEIRELLIKTEFELFDI